MDFVCTARPGGPDDPPCEFVELQDGHGDGVDAGEWVDRPDGLVALRVHTLSPHDDDDGALDLPLDAEEVALVYGALDAATKVCHPDALPRLCALRTRVHEALMATIHGVVHGLVHPVSGNDDGPGDGP